MTKGLSEGSHLLKRLVPGSQEQGRRPEWKGLAHLSNVQIEQGSKAWEIVSVVAHHIEDLQKQKTRSVADLRLNGALSPPKVSAFPKARPPLSGSSNSDITVQSWRRVQVTVSYTSVDGCLAQVCPQRRPPRKYTHQFYVCVLSFVIYCIRIRDLEIDCSGRLVMKGRERKASVVAKNNFLALNCGPA